MSGVAARRKTVRGELVRRLRNADRAAGQYDRTKRLRDLIGEHTPWYDWGHRLMALVGRNDSGSWGPPRVRDLYIRQGWQRGDDHVAIEGTENERVVTRHAMTAWDGVKRGEEWRTFDSQDDGGTVRVGWLDADTGRLNDSAIGYGMHNELALFRRWFIWDGWVKAEWFGLRRWLYYKGLHAAVERRIPFTCLRATPPGSGGYSHWHCNVQLTPLQWVRRRLHLPFEHDGVHRFVNYTWAGPGARVEYDPVAH